MKIIIDGLIFYLQKQGGISNYFEELLKGIAKEPGIDLVLLLRDGEIDRKFPESVKIVKLNSKIITRNKLFKYYSLYRDGIVVNRYLKNLNLTDSVFHYSYYNYYSVLNNGKTVVTVHDFAHERLNKYFKGMLNEVYRANKKKSINHASKLIAISKTISRELREAYKVSEDKVVTVYHGISQRYNKMAENLRHNFRFQMHIDRPYFLFVGNRRLYKNFALLLEAFALSGLKEKMDIRCVGGGEFSVDEIDLMQRLKLDSKVKLYLGLQTDGVVGLYNCAEAFVFPSEYEGFGFPLLEAMACGTIVVASDIEVFREIGGDVPIYFKSNNADSLSKVLISSIVKDDIRIFAGINQANKFKWNDTVNETIKCYRSL